MALDDSYPAAAATSPTATDSLSSSHLLSSSISSLSSSTSSARHAASYVSKTYRQASTLFLTRRLPEALSTILPLITPATAPDPSGATEPAPVARSSRTTRVKVWSLYLTILNAILELDPAEGKDVFGSQEWRNICAKVREGDVWEEVIRNGYHGIEGNVDSDVVINLATLLLAHARNQTLNQRRLESYLAAANTPNLDISDRFPVNPSSPRPPPRYRSPAKGGTSGADTPRDLNARVKILELYTLHVLLRNNEWDYAREFISMSSVLDDERREAFLQALQSLQEEQQEATRREDEEKRRQEDQLRRDIEEARRLRAENEEREKRLSEERRGAAQFGVDEVDYGIDRAPPSAAGSGRSRRSPHRPGRSGPQSSASKKSRAVAPAPSLGARAAMVLSNFQGIMEQMRVSLRSNPLLLIRLLAFVMGLLLVLGRQGVRERISRILGTSWNKLKATAGMGVKVSYI